MADRILDFNFEILLFKDPNNVVSSDHPLVLLGEKHRTIFAYMAKIFSFLSSFFYDLALFFVFL